MSPVPTVWAASSTLTPCTNYEAKVTLVVFVSPCCLFLHLFPNLLNPPSLSVLFLLASCSGPFAWLLASLSSAFFSSVFGLETRLIG